MTSTVCGMCVCMSVPAWMCTCVCVCVYKCESFSGVCDSVLVWELCVYMFAFATM